MQFTAETGTRAQVALDPRAIQSDSDIVKWV